VPGRIQADVLVPSGVPDVVRLVHHWFGSQQRAEYRLSDAKIAYGVDQLKVVFDFTIVDGTVTAIELLADAAVLAELDVELLPSAR